MVDELIVAALALCAPESAAGVVLDRSFQKSEPRILYYIKGTMELTLQKVVYLATTCMPVLPIVNSYILFSSSVIISVRPPI